MNKKNFVEAGKKLESAFPKSEKAVGFNKGSEVFDIVGAFRKSGVVINNSENEK
ncbi:MAG: hypothetical protein JW974_02140 [Alphaproteobacteria bacterium]|nr:hypothetical protein [Alphaproteobacteria bacterium]MBN2675020.1 hypothetical protein [Alphaproteobacteria bacterium]